MFLRARPSKPTVEFETLSLLLKYHAEFISASIPCYNKRRNQIWILKQVQDDNLEITKK